jgi:hypothetical protein
MSVVAAGDRPDVRGVYGGASPGRLDQRGISGVGGRCHQDAGPACPQPGDGILEPGCQGVDVGLGPQDVVAAADDADQVRLESEGIVQLGPDDVVKEPPAYRQVGVRSA